MHISYLVAEVIISCTLKLNSQQNHSFITYYTTDEFFPDYRVSLKFWKILIYNHTVRNRWCYVELMYTTVEAGDNICSSQNTLLFVICHLKKHWEQHATETHSQEAIIHDAPWFYFTCACLFLILNLLNILKQIY